jgi:hypothetical protein
MPSPPRKHFFRCTWRIDIPKNSSPEEGLRDAILETWSVLKDADRRLIVYPWHQSAHGRYKALSDMSKFPKKKETLVRYFKDAYFHPHAGPMYIRVYLGCDLTLEELEKQTSGFFNTPKNRARVGFWINPLQFEETVEIGWLFHSTPGMNADTIQEEIFRHCGIKTALRWKIIATELKGELRKALQIRAYHVSVRRDDMAAAKFVLTRKIFARHRRSHFIGGSPMRLIPIMKDVSSNHKQKCIYYVALQSSFLNKIDSMETWEIINLKDIAVGLNGASLRRLILEIPLRDDPSRQAFLSVDQAFNNASTIFYFYKANASECRSRITTLLPYLVFTNLSKEKGIKSCFSGDACERAKGVRWDAERMEVMTADDEIMVMYHLIYDEDDDQDLVDDFARKILLDFAEVTGANFGTKPAARTTKVQETDAASLFSRSTIASRQNPTGTDRSQHSKMSEDDNENDSDDTPRTVNKTLSTADTVGLSSLSTTDIQTKIDLMAQAITKFIPNTPETRPSWHNLVPLFLRHRGLAAPLTPSTLGLRLRGNTCRDQPPTTVSGRSVVGSRLPIHPDPKPPQPRIIRVGFWNCGGFPVHAGDPKDHEICQALLRYKFDMVGLAETNIAWHMLPPRQRLRERTWGWFQKLSMSSSYAFKFPAIVPFQVGGTATMAINDCNTELPPWSTINQVWDAGPRYSSVGKIKRPSVSSRLIDV